MSQVGQGATLVHGVIIFQLRPLKGPTRLNLVLAQYRLPLNS